MKTTPSKEAGWLNFKLTKTTTTTTTKQTFSYTGFLWFSISIYVIEALRCFDIDRIPQGAAILVRSLPVKSREKVASDVVYTSATHAGFLRGVMVALTGVCL